MNEHRFRQFMQAVDPALLEEAQAPMKHRSNYRQWAAVGIAACLCVAVVGFRAGRGGSTTASGSAPAEPAEAAPEFSSPMASMTTLANPLRDSSQEELAGMGYSITLPEGAGDIRYSVIDSGSGETPLAQAEFSYQQSSYTLRALKSGAEEDISGLYADWAVAMDWRMGQLSIRYNESDGTGWIGWYDGETQWCLSAVEEADAPLVDTACRVMEVLGYDVDVAPEGAEDVEYSVVPQDGLAAASCAFTLDGTRWVYSMAATSQVELPFPDISGLPDYSVVEDVELLWCPAVVSYDEGGAGKIIWFDVAPGLVYSLTADSGAGRDALLDMAGTLFTPAQGDAG